MDENVGVVRSNSYDDDECPGEHLFAEQDFAEDLRHDEGLVDTLPEINVVNHEACRERVLDILELEMETCFPDIIPEWDDSDDALNSELDSIDPAQQPIAWQLLDGQCDLPDVYDWIDLLERLERPEHELPVELQNGEIEISSNGTRRRVADVSSLGRARRRELTLIKQVRDDLAELEKRQILEAARNPVLESDSDNL